MNPGPPGVTPLQVLVPLLIEGADARSFLQGQLSNDLDLLTPQHALLASCNSAQGRVQAVLTLLAREEGLIVLLPAVLLERMLSRLRAYVLRSRVGFCTDSSAWLAAPVDAAMAESLAGALLPSPGDCTHSGALTVLRWWSAEPRYLLVAPRTAVTLAEAKVTADERWQQADIRAGLPQVYPATQETFVAQMLNLDLLQGISFSKGCYTGQEIIARTHYRGSIKRRMFRFATHATVVPAPGTRLLNGTQPAGEVVAAVGTPAGCELLAVTGLDHAAARLCLDGSPATALTRLELPYAIPAAAA